MYDGGQKIRETGEEIIATAINEHVNVGKPVLLPVNYLIHCMGDLGVVWTAWNRLNAWVCLASVRNLGSRVGNETRSGDGMLVFWFCHNFQINIEKVAETWHQI